jgi:glycosyltransferase involved in cell wall biosynthesis
MASAAPLVSIGLPLRNEEKVIEQALDSLLRQTYENIEVVVSDNASDDATEEIARAYARRDPRVRYHRQSVNIGLQANFAFVIRAATGPYFRWVGGDDRLEQSYVTRCLPVLLDDPRLLMVTSQQLFTERDGITRTEPYFGSALRSNSAIERFDELLRLLNASHLLMDPMHGLMRRERVVALKPTESKLRGDQVFAARLALAGPWAHVNEVLAHRSWPDETRSVLAERLGVPAWNARLATALEARELLGVIAEAPLTADERRAAHRSVARWYLGWHRRRVVNRGDRLLSAVGAHVSRR